MYAVNKKDPNSLKKSTRNDSPTGDNMDEESVTNSIPIAQFKPNHIGKKERFIDVDAEIKDI